MVQSLLEKALRQEFRKAEEGLALLQHAPTSSLIFVGHQLRQRMVPGNKVTWIIDRNSNTTNVCVANCKFCNFYRRPGHAESYVTTIEEYRPKIEELFRLGGDQLLLQGGHHPDLGLAFYADLFRNLKSEFPHDDVLRELKAAGLDSLPGAGAEILNDRVRRLISKGKCGAQEWLDIMRAAHRTGLTTSATMMFGHIETLMERMEHLVDIRKVQAEKPKGSVGFIAFIPWPFMDDGTLLKKLKRARNQCTADEYIRMIAISRIMLPNITHIQASWLTVGKQTAQICLHAGADDMGSIMIEENVVSAAGAPFRFTANGIQQAIRDAGYTPQLRDQQYRERELPQHIEQQELNPVTMIID